MFEDPSTSPSTTLPIDDEGEAVLQRLGRWMRVVGTIQLALSGMFLLVMGLGVLCSLGPALSAGVGLAALLTLIPVVGGAVYLLQALRIQEAGEQIKSLAETRDLYFLELTFVRLKTVFIIDLVLGVLLGIFEVL